MNYLLYWLVLGLRSRGEVEFQQLAQCLTELHAALGACVWLSSHSPPASGGRCLSRPTWSQLVTYITQHHRSTFVFQNTCLRNALASELSKTDLMMWNTFSISLLLAWTENVYVNFTHSCLWGQRRQWHPTPVLLPGKSHGYTLYDIYTCTCIYIHTYPAYKLNKQGDNL